MARVLTRETSLADKSRSIAGESRALQIILHIEASLTILLLIAGVAYYLATAGTALLIAAGIAGFLTVGHWLKVRENVVERRKISAGRMGELRVSRILERELGDEYSIVNDFELVRGKRRAQIDHLVVGPNGLFLMETKNYAGLIQGDGQGAHWIQTKTRGGSASIRVNLRNPVQQIQNHREVLTGYLRDHRIPWEDICAAVVSVNRNAVFQIANQTVPILQARSAPYFIQGYTSSRRYSQEEIEALLGLFLDRQSAGGPER